jgi:hypothetical protein
MSLGGNGRIAPGGSLPVNTGGGQLSSFYMWGMTPICEGVIQVRGEGGGRQVSKHDVAPFQATVESCQPIRRWSWAQMHSSSWHLEIGRNGSCCALMADKVNENKDARG